MAEYFLNAKGFIYMKSCKKCPKKQDRLNKVGGQAVLEGVMMKAGEKTVTTCRKEDGSLVVYDGEFRSVRKKHKILNLPIIRGVVNFAEMLALSYKTLEKSAEALGIDEKSEAELEKEARRKAKKEEKAKKKAERRGTVAKSQNKPETKAKKSGDSSATLGAVMVISLILGLALAISLFVILPNLAAGGLEWLYSNYLSDGKQLSPYVEAIVAGVIKVLIFIAYLALVALMPEIKRTFMYHGAEHKSIACFESGDELTPENAKKHKRFHPRCGTSFMFIMIFIGIIVGMLTRVIFPDQKQIVYSALALLILPLTVGVGYEIIMIAGKHDNFITRIVSAPGLWIQRITTKEPTEEMLEVAITSIKCALRDEYPEFREFYENKEWEKGESTEAVTDGQESGETEAEPAAEANETEAEASSESENDA